MRYDICDESISLLRNVAKQLSNSAVTIEYDINRLILFLDDYSLVLSSHQEKLYEILTRINNILNENDESIVNSANMINELADKYDLIVRRNIFSDLP